jgi:hypothetical protein
MKVQVFVCFYSPKKPYKRIAQQLTVSGLVVRSPLVATPRIKKYMNDAIFYTLQDLFRDW